MMKITKKQAQCRIAPVLMGLGLWLIGNALLGVQSAKGQEVAAFSTPTPNPYYYQVSNQCASYGYCTRFFEDIYGCKTTGSIGSNCDASVIRSVAVYYEKSPCTGTSSQPNVCDWASPSVTTVSKPDACEQSSKATGSGNCPVG